MSRADSVSAQQPGAVAVFPIPGTQYNLPHTQITFRGIDPDKIGQITVTGSKSGVHAGRWESDSDGHGASFLPDAAFTPGETVSVATSLDVLAAQNGNFQFTIASPYAQRIGVEHLPYAPAGDNGVQHFHSRPDLRPAAVTVTDSAPEQAPGDIFVAPQAGPSQNGPMILGSRGNLIWFHPNPTRNTLATDFRVQELHGQRVLTWFQGTQNKGSGRGVGEIYNDHYKQIGVVHAGNGLKIDLHEFRITNAGDAWVIGASMVMLPGQSRPVVDSVVQEIDIKTGLVLFEWHSLDHVNPNESDKYGNDVAGHVLDPYHMNSITFAADGDPIVSMRNTSAIYEIDKRSGQIIWRLGGKRSSFRLGPGTGTAFQHDAIAHPGNVLTIFDNGAGPPRIQPSSQGLEIRLDTANATATLIHHYNHHPGLSANFEGSVQTLPDGDVFLGYGQQPDFTEFKADGQEVFDAHFNARTDSYRAYRFPWVGHPLTQPRVRAIRDGDGQVTLYMSWNGATGITRWGVIGGSSTSTLQRLMIVPSQGFETTVTVPVRHAIEVAPLNADGNVMSVSLPAHFRTATKHGGLVASAQRAAKRRHRRHRRHAHAFAR